jgi:hypothetical protein
MPLFRQAVGTDPVNLSFLTVVGFPVWVPHVLRLSLPIGLGAMHVNKESSLCRQPT